MVLLHKEKAMQTRCKHQHERIEDFTDEPPQQAA